MSQDNPDDLRFPEDPTKMTRKERRQWYKENRKRLGLPRWNELRRLEANKK